MQSVSSRIWTRVVVSISYDDNHYTTGTSRECNLLPVDRRQIFPFADKIDKLPEKNLKYLSSDNQP